MMTDDEIEPLEVWAELPRDLQESLGGSPTNGPIYDLLSAVAKIVNKQAEELDDKIEIKAEEMVEKWIHTLTDDRLDEMEDGDTPFDVAVISAWEAR